MSTSPIKIPPEFESASGAERIDFVQELWSRIADNPDSVPLPESHKRILDARIEEMESNSDLGRPWSEVREQLLKALNKR